MIARLIDRIRRDFVKRDVIKLIRFLEPRDAGAALVRIGGESDGGYLVPDDLVGIDRCFSPGVGFEATFELALLERGIESTLIDGTVVSAPDSRLDFLPLNLGLSTGGRSISMRDWIARFDRAGDLILQMDIEGAEFDIIPTILRRDLARFRIIVIELHLNRLHDHAVRRSVMRTIRALQRDFETVHVHPNNCCGVRELVGLAIPRVIEVTLLRRDRLPARPRRPSPLPHPLDRPNVGEKPELRIPSAWLNIWSRHRQTPSGKGGSVGAARGSHP